MEIPDVTVTHDKLSEIFEFFSIHYICNLSDIFSLKDQSSRVYFCILKLGFDYIIIS